jgi:hypothetical protein
MNMLLFHQGHWEHGHPSDHANDLGPLDLMNPYSNYMGGGYALPYGMMSPAMMGYGGFGFGMGFPGGMPMGAYNYPDKQDDGHDDRKLILKQLRV